MVVHELSSTSCVGARMGLRSRLQLLESPQISVYRRRTHDRILVRWCWVGVSSQRASGTYPSRWAGDAMRRAAGGGSCCA